MRRWRVVFTLWATAFSLIVTTPSVARADSVDFPKLDEIASTVAGRAIDAQCVVSYEEWNAELQSLGAPATVLGYYSPRQPDVIRLGPGACLAFRDGPGGRSFGAALNIIAHEASHARGVRSEATAACWGLLWPADLARRFYGIEFFTPASELIVASSRAAHEFLLPIYREECR